MNPPDRIEQLLKLVATDRRAEARKLISELLEKEEGRHKETARELNEARLAALNMMEDSLLAKKRLELTQFSIDHSADPVFWIRPDASFAYVNKAAGNQLGWSQDDLLHMSVMDIDPDFPAEVWPAHWQELKKKGGLTFETHHRTSDGRIFPVLIHASFICFDGQEYVSAFAHDITIQKQTERYLKESRKSLQITLNSIGDAVISTNTAGRITLMNPMAEKLTGWTLPEAVGKPLQDIFKIIHEQTRSPVENPLTKVIATGRIVRLANHTLLIAKDGSEIPIADSGAPICDDTGKITGVVLVFRDQSKERAARRYIEESETRYRLLFDNMSTGFALHEMIYDPQGNPIDYRYLQVNPAFEKLTGLRAKQAVGRTAKELLPKLEDVWIEKFGRVATTGEPAAFENYTQDLDRFFEVRAFCPAPGQFAVVFSDITARKKIEQELELSRQFLRTVIDTIPVRVFWKDRNSAYLGCNMAFAQDAGLDSPEKLIGKTDFDLSWTREQAEDFRADDRKVILSGIPKLNFEEPQTRPDQTLHWLKTNKLPLRDAQNNCIGVIGTYEDITAHKLAEKALLFEKSLFTSFMETIPANVYFKDLQSRFVRINQRFADFFGKSKDELIGKSDLDLFPEEQARKKLADEQQVMQTRQPTQLEELSGTVWHMTTKAPRYDENGELAGTFGISWNITERVRLRQAIEKRILALTCPVGDAGEIAFEELFDVAELQRIQDEFAAATGIAAILILPDGTPVTEPSNFTSLCNDMIRKKAKGCSTCFNSDAEINRHHSEGLVVRQCICSGLWEAGVSITIGDRHIANWLIGQVRDETQTDDTMRACAKKIGADEAAFIEAFHNVPFMSRKQLEQVAQSLFTLANQLSTSAYQNMQQARFITEQKKTEQALRESQEYLASMWSLMDIGILLVDAESRQILNLNPALLKISGYKKEDLTGKVCHSLVCPAEKGNCPVGDLGLTVDRSERTLIHADGHEVSVEKSVKLITLNERNVYLETIIDITARKEAEKELRRLSTAIEQSPETIVITNANGLIQYVNPAFETITGYSAQEALGKNPRILRSGQHDKAFYVHLWGTIQSGEVWHGRFINKRKNGELYTEEASISPVRDPAGHLIGYVANKRDITEELAREEQFRQSQKMQAVGQLAGGVAHDFNNILQAILGFSEILLMRINKEGIEYHNVTEIQKAALRAADLTRQLLAFSRKQPVRKQQIDLNAAISESQTLIKMLTGEQIRCVFDLAPVLSPVLIDHGQVTQIIMNLAVNARDAMPNGGQLTLSTKNVSFGPEKISAIPNARAGYFACISIADSGSGMSQDVKDHLFEPFFTTKKLGSGTGLGLSVVYGIIQQNMGWIHVDSEEGKGSVFNVYLPACEMNTAAAGQPENPVAPGEKRLLLVEADDAVRDMAVSALETAGYQIEAVSSAEDALTRFDQKKNSVDLLISDINLPGKNGIELANLLREKKGGLSVLLYSDDVDPLKQWNDIDLKGYQFIQKPFLIETLLTSVYNALQAE